MLYGVEDLGPSQGMTSEGFLVCRDVPIARTGELIYAPGELPIAPGPDGLVRVQVDDASLFDPACMATLEGKDIVEGHPAGGIDVTNTNWREFSVGHMQNVRRGVGKMVHTLVADLLIKRAPTIDLVRNKGLRQVSLGYTGRYQVVRPGLARRTTYRVNHVALVRDGRAGAECSIGDAAPDRMQLVNGAMREWGETMNAKNREFWAARGQ